MRDWGRLRPRASLSNQGAGPNVHRRRGPRVELLVGAVVDVFAGLGQGREPLIRP